MKARGSGILSILLAWVIGFSGVSCLITGFWMDDVPILPMAFWTLGWCAVFLLFLNWKRAWIPLIGLAVFLFFARKPFLNALEALLFRLSNYYDQGYGWGVIYWSSSLPEDAPTLVLTVAGMLICAAVLWTLQRGRPVLFALLPGFAPLICCMVLTNTVPDPWCLGCLLAAAVLLLMTHSLRQRDPAKSTRLTIQLCLPVILGCFLLFSAVPEKGYTGQENAELLMRQALQWMQELNTALGIRGIQIDLPVSGDLGHVVDLTKVGVQSSRRTPVMSVFSEEGGSIYLRGQAYDHYAGTSWKITQTDWPLEDFSDWGGMTVADTSEVLVKTLQPHSVRYFSYRPGHRNLTEQLHLGSISNPDGATQYSFLKSPPIQPEDWWADYVIALGQQERYLQLPDNTWQQARQILKENIGNPKIRRTMQDQYDLAQAIVSYVRDSAPYSLYTHRMPSEEKDFAIWFLTSSPTGYCSHFASAATVLLRAANIPARYVTGYLVQTAPGEWTNVSARNAHAWVECYISGAGWIPLEPTPSNLNSPVPPETQSSEPVETQPSEPVETQPSEPVETQPSGTGTRPPVSDTTDPVETQPGTTEGSATTGSTAATETQPLPWIPPETVQQIRNVLLITVLSLVAIIGQWRLRLSLRFLILHSGHPNRQALRRWKECRMLSRLLKQEPDPRLLPLAEKARFSQHTLTAEELRIFDEYRAQAIQGLQTHPFPRKLLYRLILALY